MSDAKKPAEPATPPPAASSKLMPALVGFNSLLLVGVLGFMGYQLTHKPAEDHGSPDEARTAEAKPKEESEPKAEEHEGGKKEGAVVAAGAGPGPMMKLPDFVVHLRNPDLDRYARITFEVEVMAEADKDRLTAHLPKVRDAFISYLSDRTVEELSGSEGLTRTKDALHQRLREIVPEARFRALYISDFVVQ
jgi:flagellar protein FliL